MCQSGNVFGKHVCEIISLILQSMLLTAIDTTAGTTEWAISSLLQHPEVLERAQEELDVVVGRERVLDESDLPNGKIDHGRQILVCQT